MAKPIHIMRWAPADYVNDPSVKLALAQRDFVSSTFYPLFLFHAFIQGGELPAEPVALAAIVGMRPVDVRRALAFWIEQGKIREADGRLYHERVRRDIAAELEFRAGQSEKGKLGGRPAKGKPFYTGNPVVFDRQSPPAPLPAPAPTPVAGASDEPTFDRDAWVRRGWAAIRTLSGLTGEEPELIAMEGSSYKRHDGTIASGRSDIRGLTQDRLVKTVLDLEATLKSEQASQKPKATA